jgi:ATP-dependent Clp protease ATP-binding subunit ClpC
VFERFTQQARQVIVLAQDEARALGHDYIGTEHILLGLLRDEEGLAGGVLRSLGVTLEEARAHVASLVGQEEAAASGQMPFTPGARKVLELSLREAISLGHDSIGAEHILLALTRVDDGVAARVLLEVDVGADAIRDEVVRAMAGQAERFSDAARLREQHRRVRELFAEIEANLRALYPEGLAPSTRGEEAARWEYAVKVLEGSAESWPEQLTAWRRDGWELLTITADEGVQQALLERRR